MSSDITLQRKELSGVLNAENMDEVEILGRAMMYGVGEVVVERDWLLNRLRKHNVPEMIHPKKKTPHAAYKRAMSRMVTTNTRKGRSRTDTRWIHFSDEGEQLKVELELKAGDGRSNVRHLRADVFFPEELCGQDGGKYVTHELGHFNYDTESQTVVTQKNSDCPEALLPLWREMEARAKTLHEEMLESHTGDDLRSMVYNNMILNSPPEWPSVVPLRDAGAVYFIPEGPLSDVIDSLAEIFSEIDRKWKEGGKNIEIRTIEVVDSEEKREWIQQRVEQSLDGMVDEVLEEAFEMLEDEEETSEAIVETVVEQLGEGAGSTAVQYNQLLEAQLSVEKVLIEKASEVGDKDKERIIEQALQSAEI